MNRKAIVIASALLALSAIVMRRMLRNRQDIVPPPAAVEMSANAHDPVTSSQAVEAVGDALVTAPPLETVATPARSPAAATSPKAVAQMDAQLRPIREAIESSYASTLAAFALHGEEADYEAHDARAQADVDRLQELFSSMRGELTPEVTSSCEALIAQIAAAQLQLMAFAINRKNRGLPDSAQEKAELTDRKAFQEGSASLFDRLKVLLNTDRVEPSQAD